MFTLLLATALAVPPAAKDAPTAITGGLAWLDEWLMKSRPFGAESKTAKNLEPITYASTSWALLGLIRSTPKK